MDAFAAGLNQQDAVKILEMFPGPQDLVSLQTIAAIIDSRISTHVNFFSNYNQTTSSFRNRKNNTGTNKNVTKTNSHNSPLSKEENKKRRKTYVYTVAHQITQLTDVPKEKLRNQETQHLCPPIQ